MQKIINIKYSSKILFILLIISTLTNAFSQELPFVINYTPKDYGYESQNFSIIQNKNKLIYVANLNGILEYDGSFWRLIKINGIPNFTFSKNHKIFVGGYNNFGYLDFDIIKGSVFHSLLSKFKKGDRDFGQIKKLITVDDNIFFYSKNTLFYYSNDTIGKVNLNLKFYNIFKIDKSIYIASDEKGLLKYENGDVSKIENSDYFKNKIILGIIKYQNKLLIKVYNQKGFVLYSNNNITKFNTEADEYIQKNIFVDTKVLYNGELAIGTEKGGIIIIDENGKIKTLLNKQNGLISDEVTSLFIDSEKNLWATFNYGISKIEYPSAFLFISNKNLHGHLNSISSYNDVVYIGTSLGLYKLNNKITLKDDNCYAQNNLTHIDDIQGSVNQMLKINNGILISTDNGLYLLDKNGIKIILNIFPNIVCQSKYNKGIFYFGDDNGFGAFKKVKNEWKVIGRLKKLDKPVRTISEEQNNIWLGTNYNGVFLVDRVDSFDIDADVIQFKSGYGLPVDYKWIDVYCSSLGPMFSTYKGVYFLDKENYSFYPDTLLGFNSKSHKLWVYPIIEDKNRIWFSKGYSNLYKKTTGFLYLDKKTNKYTSVTEPFNRIQDFIIENIYPQNNTTTWFGSFAGLIKFNRNLLTKDTSEILTLFRKIIIGKDTSKLKYILPLNMRSNVVNNDSIPKVNYSDNDIQFYFASTYYTFNSDIKYKYKLENYDKKWSNWESQNFKEYTNLSEGEYIFKVKSKNIYNKISSTATYKFIIKPPIYRTSIAYLIYLVLISLFIYMIYRWRVFLFAEEKYKLEKSINERTEELIKQKERIEQLVENVLPKDTARELETKGRATRKKYERVTVLFSDIQGFTKIAENAKPEQLLDELDNFFLKFDEVVEKYGIEKIKTIGDAYMCAGGIPKKNSTNPIDVIMAAIEIRNFMHNFKQQAINDWDIRIGIHTGPVIAGVVGSKKYSYDIWGDTVNIASRMESSGLPGEINISEETYLHISKFFDCEHRGKIPVKYKGDIDMFFVKNIKKEYSVNGEGKEFNEEFYKRLQWVRFNDLESLVMYKLEKGLPKYLKYHNARHTIDVMVEVEILGSGEKVSRDDLLILKTAALFHDLGHIVQSENHEEIGSKMAQEILPEYKYSKEQIEIISRLILSTKYPPNPQDYLERIICDADLDYLGRSDFIPVSNQLYKEMQAQGNLMTTLEWNKMQVSFLENHKYFTETATKLRTPNKLKQLENIKKLVEDEENKANNHF